MSISDGDIAMADEKKQNSIGFTSPNHRGLQVQTRESELIVCSSLLEATVFLEKIPVCPLYICSGMGEISL